MAGFLTNLISKMSAVIKAPSDSSTKKHSIINYTSLDRGDSYNPDNNQNNVLSIHSYRKTLPKTLPAPTTSYVNVTNPFQVEIIFKKFRDVLVDKLSYLTRTSSGSISYPAFFKDAGKSQGNKSYFYIQPYNQSGLLFEENQSGWTVSLARYNAEEKTYTKEKEILENIELFIPKTGIGNIRINSQLFNLKLVTFKAYEEKIINKLELYLKNADTFSFSKQEKETATNKEELLG